MLNETNFIYLSKFLKTIDKTIQMAFDLLQGFYLVYSYTLDVCNLMWYNERFDLWLDLTRSIIDIQLMAVDKLFRLLLSFETNK